MAVAAMSATSHWAATAGNAKAKIPATMARMPINTRVHQTVPFSSPRKPSTTAAAPSMIVNVPKRNTNDRSVIPGQAIALTPSAIALKPLRNKTHQRLQALLSIETSRFTFESKPHTPIAHTRGRAPVPSMEKGPGICQSPTALVARLPALRRRCENVQFFQFANDLVDDCLDPLAQSRQRQRLLGLMLERSKMLIDETLERRTAGFRQYLQRFLQRVDFAAQLLELRHRGLGRLGVLDLGKRFDRGPEDVEIG